ncbi:hypothetical protein ABBQ32_008817 [Trebouxia sp. C0010 RCD-2024]
MAPLQQFQFNATLLSPGTSNEPKSSLTAAGSSSSDTQMVAKTQPCKLASRAGSRHYDSHWRQRQPAGFARLILVLVSCCLLPSILCQDLVLDAEGHASQVTGMHRCCTAGDCVNRPTDQHAVVTSVRTPEYVVMLRDLHCSVTAHSPSVKFIVMAVAGELSSEVTRDIQEFAEYLEVPNIEYSNTLEARYSKNWFKLNAWNMTEYASIIMLDADVIITQDLRHIFSLPTDFAWSYLNAPNNYNWNAGGFIMLRPCRPVFEHMLQVLEADESKRFPTEEAEQAFFHWYFEFTGMRLPLIYNANSNFLQENGLTVSGVAPVVVHFADSEAKPFKVTEGDPRWKYMCYRYKQHHRQHSPLFDSLKS